jgi:TetR/AcrR family tetracycline transcriptional repressor
MPAGRKPSHSRESLVQAALNIADTQGIGALTVRALGSAIGASATAVYRYFDTKSALIDAIRQTLLAHTASTWVPDPDPTESLVSLARAVRTTAQLHPSFGPIMMISATRNEANNGLPLVIIDHLERLGVAADSMVVAYRQLETLTIGSAIFDFGGAPHHLSDRRERMTHLGRSEFIAQLSDDEAVARINDEAFEKNFRLVLKSLLDES